MISGEKICIEIRRPINHYSSTNSIWVASLFSFGFAPAFAGGVLIQLISGGKMKIKVLAVISLAAVALLAACGKSDADIQKAVSAKLAADNVTGVTVSVNGGVATLTGEVADITVKNKAAASAKIVEGVKSVTDSTTLRPLPTPVPAPADPMLKGKVEENLKKAGCTGATVETSGGTVTLSGTVPDAKFAECVKVASESGAAKFENKLVRGK